MDKDKRMIPIVQVGDVLLSPDILTRNFCCDLKACKGQCCVEGDAGAPVTLDEVAAIEESLETVWGDLSASAQTMVDRQGVAYTDSEGDLVTSIVAGRDCVFTCYDSEGTCLCALEKAFLAGKTRFRKPISCALYPIREKKLPGGLVGLNYNEWIVCKDAVALGNKLGLPIYRFLKNPLVQRFGQEWYDELEATAEALLSNA